MRLRWPGRASKGRGEASGARAAWKKGQGMGTAQWLGWRPLEASILESLLLDDFFLPAHPFPISQLPPWAQPLQEKDPQGPVWSPGHIPEGIPKNTLDSSYAAIGKGWSVPIVGSLVGISPLVEAGSGFTSGVKERAQALSKTIP